MTAMASPKQVSQINRINALANPEQSMAVRIATATASPTRMMAVPTSGVRRRMLAARSPVVATGMMVGTAEEAEMSRQIVGNDLGFSTLAISEH
jgi:hypothetical protein